MALRADDRAQAIGFSRFIMAVFVVGSILWFILDQVARPLATGAENSTTNATLNQGSAWLVDFIDLLPAIILVTGALGVIVLAIYQREVLR